MSSLNKVDRAVNRMQCIEFGLLLTLVALLLALAHQDKVFVQAAIVIVLISMIVPMAFYPFAYVWFTLARVLGGTGPVLLLGIVFFLVVMPIGIFRRLLRKDAVHRRRFKKDIDSAMITRNHLYKAGDFQKMF